MEVQLFKEEVALKLKYEKEALDARASDSDDSAAPIIRSRSPIKLSSFVRAKTRIDNNYPRVSFNRESVLKPWSPSKEPVSSARQQDKFKRKKPSSSSQLTKLKLSSFDGNPL